MTIETSSAEPTRQRAPQSRLYGLLLMVAAGLALALPLPYQALQSVGTQDGDHLNLAGYESRLALLQVPAVRVHKGDTLLEAVRGAHDASALNHSAVLRLGFALVAGLPGAFLLGRYPKQPG